MTFRSEEDKRQEAASIIAAQIANGGQRDAFVALGHTVLFTASLAFVEDIRGEGELTWVWLLLFSWTLSVIGLFALTWSFHEAHAAADKRLVDIHDDDADDGVAKLNLANSLALWSFPICMLATTTFAGLNLWGA